MTYKGECQKVKGMDQKKRPTRDGPKARKGGRDLQEDNHTIRVANKRVAERGWQETDVNARKAVSIQTDKDDQRKRETEQPRKVCDFFVRLGARSWVKEKPARKTSCKQQEK